MASKKLLNMPFMTNFIRRQNLRDVLDWSSSTSANAKWLFHRENGRDAGLSTSTRINLCPFFVLAGLCLRLRCNKLKRSIPLRHNTSTLRIFTTRGYVWLMKTLDPDYLAPEQFFKMREGSNDFAWACVCVEFRFHLGHSYCLCLRLWKTRLRSNKPMNRQLLQLMPNARTSYS